MKTVREDEITQCLCRGAKSYLSWKCTPKQNLAVGYLKVINPLKLKNNVSTWTQIV